MPNIKVSFIFVNRNNTPMVLESIQSVLSLNTKYTSEIFVVDNGSQENTAAQIKKKFKQVTVIALQNNQGTNAFNHALSKCKGEYIYFLPGDVALQKNSLNPLIDFLDKNKDAGQASPKLISSHDKKSIDMAGTWLSKSMYAAPIKDASLGNTITQIPYMGVGIIRKSIIDTFGYLYDPDYFFYGEDVDLGLRIKLIGYRVYYVPQSRAYHAGSISRNSKNAHRLTFLMERNLMTTFLKIFGAKTILRYLPYVFGMRCAAAAKDIGQGRWRSAYARLHALVWTILHIPTILKKRSTLQKLRTVTDKEIMALCSDKYLI